MEFESKKKFLVGDRYIKSLSKEKRFMPTTLCSSDKYYSLLATSSKIPFQDTLSPLKMEALPVGLTDIDTFKIGGSHLAAYDNPASQNFQQHSKDGCVDNYGSDKVAIAAYGQLIVFDYYTRKSTPIVSKGLNHYDGTFCIKSYEQKGTLSLAVARRSLDLQVFCDSFKQVRDISLDGHYVTSMEWTPSMDLYTTSIVQDYGFNTQRDKGKYLTRYDLKVSHSKVQSLEDKKLSSASEVYTCITTKPNDNNYVILGTSAGRIHVVDVRNFKIVNRVKVKGAEVTGLNYAKINGSYCLVGFDGLLGGSISMWDNQILNTSKPKPLFSLGMNYKAIANCFWNQKEERLLILNNRYSLPSTRQTRVGVQESAVEFWKLSNANQMGSGFQFQKEFKTNLHRIQSSAFRGDTLATFSSRKELKVRVISKLQKHQGKPAKFKQLSSLSLDSSIEESR